MAAGARAREQLQVLGKTPIHLLTMARGRSACPYYDITDFVAWDTIEEDILAGTKEGKQIVVKSRVKAKLDSITLSQWSIANLALLYRLMREGNWW